MDNKAAEIRQMPEFKALTAARRRLNTPIVAIIIAAYFGFVLLIAYDPAVLGRPLGGSVSIGIYAGLGLLVLSYLLTVVYLWLSQRYVAPLQDRLRDKILSQPKQS